MQNKAPGDLAKNFRAIFCPSLAKIQPWFADSKDLSASMSGFSLLRHFYQSESLGEYQCDCLFNFSWAIAMLLKAS
jgi:hypothetical protein